MELLIPTMVLGIVGFEAQKILGPFFYRSTAKLIMEEVC
jgi:hypothetical protein